ncbi:hypothetical protein SAMN04487938_3571 [Lysobacter sp. cf310]|nr:hypothetical protein SAMN04487938_3571 [Lysobacter sp. cf310]
MASKRHNSKSRRHAGAAADQRNAVRHARSTPSCSSQSVTNAREPS